MRGRNGFTLVELVVTLGVIALILAATTARFDRMFVGDRLESSGHGLGDHFAYAVTRAFTTGSYHTVVLDLDTLQYSIKMGREDEESAPILNRRLATGVKFSDVQIGYEVYQAPGTLQIEISPLGVTSDVLVNLEDEGGREAAVWINGLVQGVRYFDEHKTYQELQELPGG